MAESDGRTQSQKQHAPPQDSKTMKGRRQMFKSNLSKSMPTMRSNAEMLAEDDYIMSLRFSRRCERIEGDTSPFPAPTKFRKSQTNLFSESVAPHRLMRTLSQPNMETRGYRLENIPEKSDEMIFKALRMVVYFNPF
jgi:hypothetical protein